ncbi:Gfo/Idh/MocA family protein [Lederbergia lenta]|uniref:NADH-dependent dyhydrogenase n=1 Tax=Lederbergia lenta TaxID=1467 RepID=A0A2X4ZQY7_LEDLE|nr:Gfo/Idh/MocA family oxidoreductase [Lederbergia lenta]MCM3111960.1 Gfo/Idh/MocA family oxidoreductase [Lederbergia lenta]MEC2323135.1 Gfo/Idh/MocA family oxidoreductase [Lederbergia lenta]SQI62784.1 NADH-dependent dyhydrogenase [Lederbergia lenta]
MKVGIISCAHSHAYSYASGLQSIEGVEIVGIADNDMVKGKEFAETFNIPYYSSYQAFLEIEMDAVIVTSENVHHKEHVKAAAKAQKHILCEKPLATTIEDAQEMIDICRENNVILQTAFPVRFNSNIVRAKEILDSGRIGEIIGISGTNRGTNPQGWFVDKELSGGGAVMDHTVHVVDIIRWFTNSEIKEVYCESDQLFSNTPIDDAGILTMELDNEIFATLDCSWSRNQAYPTWGDVTLDIVGTKGTLKIDAFDQNVRLYSEKQGVKRIFIGDDMNLGLVEDFIDSVRNGTPPSITGLDGLRAVEVALAAYQSSERKEAVKV